MTANGSKAVVADAGYSIDEEVFTAAECNQLLTVLAGDAIVRSKAGVRHLMSNTAVAELASDLRMLAIAGRALGGTAVPFRATLFDKSGESNWLVVWHQDTALPLVSRFDSPEWGPWSVKAGVAYAHAPGWALERVVALRLHLDGSGLENGPLRVMPGSHRQNVMSDEAIFDFVRCHDALDCVIARGGVLAMKPLLIHSSPKATAPEPRRVLHIEYADRLELAPGIRLAIS